MSLPAIVTARLGEEDVVAQVPLGGEDALCVTPTRTLRYRAEGLLSDESVAEVSHDAERLDVRSGRRKATFRLSYLDDIREFSVPASKERAVLEPVLEGVLRAADVVEADEHVQDVFRFSELTLVVTDARVVKHVGGAVWDADYEAFPFADLTGLDYEEGRVATQVVLEVEGRPHRVKVPNDGAGGVRKALETAVFAYHDVGSLAELDEKVGVEREERDSVEAFTALVETDADQRPTDSTDANVSADANDNADHGRDSPADDAVVDDAATADATATDAAVGGGSPTVEMARDHSSAGTGTPEALTAQLEALTRAVERQNDLLREQGATIDRLVEELRQGR